MTKKSKTNSGNSKGSKQQLKAKKAAKVSVYRNLINIKNSKNTKDAKKTDNKHKAQELADLPKHPVKRFLYRMHPKRVAKFVFSKKGAFLFLKIFLVMVAIGGLSLTMLYLHYRKEVNNLRPEEVAKRIQTSVNRYVDRNGKLLWEDKGDGNYKLVVKQEEISDYIKKATVAIEDRDFYKHKGVSLSGIARAVVNNLRGGSVQGGSTLTQQLIKQAFFAEEAQERGIKGIPRKIKEMILAVELERLFSKDQILTMYLNESPYGGRRNGVESGAQTYFGKHAKDVTLAEAALLAAIPNNPARYNPYWVAGHKALIARQHKVLHDMVETGAITQAEADEAKKVAILDTLKPESSQWKDIKAPHFVLEAKREAEEKLGVKVLGKGGLTIKTTLDLDAQAEAEAAVAAGSKLSAGVGADNLAMSSVDVETGQIIAMVGSVDFFKPGYGQRNAAVSKLEPGSSIKPIADIAPLFMKREGLNYGPGSILRDEDIRNIYCINAPASCNVQNYTRRTYGDVTIRQSLANSLNRPLIKAMHIVGVDQAIDIARRLGDKSYCQGNSYIGLSSAIGGGCTLKLTEHTNAYASLARGGAYLPLSYLIEITDNNKNQLYLWKKAQPDQVIDPQSAYMVTDILADAASRNLVFGSMGYSYGFVVPGVWTASKTGTTDNGAGRAKDSWMMSYSNKIATGVWSGNHDGAPLTSDSNHVVRRVIHNYMEGVHKNVYAKQGKWKSGDKIAQPAGLKHMSFMGKTDLWPSWFNPDSAGKKERLMFDKISKKKATECTPELARIEQDVWTVIDPVSKKETKFALDGYNPNENDDVHQCSDTQPQVDSMRSTRVKDKEYSLEINLKPGKHPLSKVIVVTEGKTIYDSAPTGNTVTVKHTFATSRAPIEVIVQDGGGYQSKKSFIGPTLSNS